ncbi:MAG: GntR family transcriptional regulator [Tenericutes bacterium]|nr:GntR family transcriptional regulator [Mycoplasmatota bacterium]
MDYIKINRLVTTSIYKQIASGITEAIDSGLLKYGDKLPTEKEICQAFSISHTVVKMAYENLIVEGKIKRIKGKGTYVTNRANFHTDLHAFYEVDIKNNDSKIKYNTEVVLFDRIVKDYSAYRALKLENGEKCYKIVTLTKSEQNPIVLQKIYLPEKLYPNFLNCYNSFDKLYDFLESDCCNKKINGLHSIFSAINVSAPDALLLNLNNDEAISFIRTKIEDKNDEIIAYVCSYFPGDLSEFEVIVHAI